MTDSEPNPALNGPINQQMIRWFRHSAPYINAHRNKTMVLLLSGEAIADDNFINTVHDIALLNSLGVRLILACGARLQIETLLADLGVNSEFHQGLRVTDARMLEVVKQASGAVRANVEALLSTGVINSPMHGAGIRAVSGNYVTARPIGVRDGKDFGFTGEVRKVDSHGISRALDQGNIVLLPSLGYSPTGEIFNLSVEEVATQVAIDLKVDKLIAFVHAKGALDDQGNLLRELRPGDCAGLLNSTELPVPFRQSLRACYNAMDQGVPRAHLISYRDDGALLGELFTRDGSGTLITQGSYEQIRQATIEDVGGIVELIQPLEADGLLVRRSRDLLENEIEQFTIIERDGMIVACIALYPYGDENMAEVACVATHEDYRSANRASVLLQAAEQRAQQTGMHSLFVLTTQTAHWFIEKGFSEADISDLPVAKQALYNYQRNSKVFIKTL